jgi:hypothetical protein
MRYGQKNNFMKLYADNPDKISMVVLLHDNKLAGRALIWKLDDGSTYLDRIYYQFDSDINLIYEWVTEKC